MDSIIKRLLESHKRRLNESIKLGDEVTWRGNKYTIIDDEDDQLTLRPSSMVDDDSFEGYGDSSEDIFLDRYQLKVNMNEAAEINQDHKRQIEDILNHQLYGNESDMRVTDMELVSQTPENITYKVEYEVNIRIPYVDYGDNRTYYEDEVEYRTRTMTIDLK